MLSASKDSGCGLFAFAVFQPQVKHIWSSDETESIMILSGEIYF